MGGVRFHKSGAVAKGGCKIALGERGERGAFQSDGGVWIHLDQTIRVKCERLVITLCDGERDGVAKQLFGPAVAGEELAVGLRRIEMAVGQGQGPGPALQRGLAEGLALETFLERLERLLRTIQAEFRDAESQVSAGPARIEFGGFLEAGAGSVPEQEFFQADGAVVMSRAVFGTESQRLFICLCCRLEQAQLELQMADGLKKVLIEMAGVARLDEFGERLRLLAGDGEGCGVDHRLRQRGTHWDSF